MSRLKIAFIINAVIVLIVSFVLIIAFNNSFPSNKALAAYIASKAIVTIVFVGVVVYAFTSKAKTGSSTTLVIAATVYQLLPLAIRFFVKSDVKNAAVYAWVISLVSLGLFVAFSLGLSSQDKLMLQQDDASHANEIKVVEEKRLSTDDKVEFEEEK